MLRVTVLPLFLGYLAVCSSLQPSQESYQLHRELLAALENASFTRYALSELFFPRTGGVSPVCAPISYALDCADGEYNVSFLWSIYDTKTIGGRMLISSAYYGFTLDGFDLIENQCLFFHQNTTTLVQLDVELECSEEETWRVLLDELTGFTSAVSASRDQYLWPLLQHARCCVGSWHDTILKLVAS